MARQASTPACLQSPPNKVPLQPFEKCSHGVYWPDRKDGDTVNPCCWQCRPFSFDMAGAKKFCLPHKAPLNGDDRVYANSSEEYFCPSCKSSLVIEYEDGRRECADCGEPLPAERKKKRRLKPLVRFQTYGL